VLKAGRGDEPEARECLEKLCSSYWLPLYAYARRRGYSEADAKDLTQAFFAWVLERDWFNRADRERGRFRSFLLTSMSHFLANEWDKAMAQKRGRGQIVPLPGIGNYTDLCWEPADHVTPEQSFERRWALTLLDHVMNRLRADYENQGKAELFDVLKPCLIGERSAQPYAALARQLGMTEGAIKVTVHRLRSRYRELLRQEIANTVTTPEEIDEELRHLFGVLAAR
jgi:RNA polymerase sigma-70 factor (ECF subfamily)